MGRMVRIFLECLRWKVYFLFDILLPYEIRLCKLVSLVQQNRNVTMG